MAIELEVRSDASKAFSVIDKLRAKLSGIKETEVKIDARGAERAKQKVDGLNKSLDKTKAPRAPRIDTRQLEADTRKISSNMDNVARAAENVRSAVNMTALAVGGMAAVTAYSMLADKMTNLENRLKAVTKDAQSFGAALRDVEQIAFSTRSNMNETAALFSRLVQSSEQLEASQSQVASLTAAVSKALVVGGASAQESASAMLQLGQAMGSGVLQGQELVAIMESSVTLSRAIADGMGVTTGALKKMGAEGRLTSKEVFDAILKQSFAINKQFEKMDVTFGQAFTNLGNAGTLLFNAVNKAFLGKASPARFINDVALGIRGLAKNFDFLLFKYSNEFLLFAGTVQTALTSVFDAIPEAAVRGVNAIKAAIGGADVIDAAAIFPQLSKIPDFIQNIVSKIEHSFFWLYDRVIGHSWVPDLVEGTLYWFAKLSTVPVKIVEGLVYVLDGLFYSASLAVGKISEVIGKVKGNANMSVDVKTSTSIGKLPELNTDGLKQKLSDSVSAVRDNTASMDKLSTFWKATKTNFNDSVTRLEHTFNNSAMMQAFEKSDNSMIHTLKQIFGMRDKVQYTYGSGRSSSTDTTVGRGPQRDRKNPGLTHNLINSLPESAQIPVVASLAAVSLAAVAKIFSGSSLLPAMLLTVGSGFAAAIASNIENTQIKSAFASLGGVVVAAIGKGLGVLEGGNAFGILATFARMYLFVLSAGKKGMLEVLTKTAALPTTLGRSFAMNNESRRLGSTLSELDSTMRGIQKSVGSSLEDSAKNLARVQSAKVPNSSASFNATRLHEIATLQSDSLKAFAAASKLTAGTLQRAQADTKLSMHEQTLATLGVRQTAVAQLRELQGRRDTVDVLQKNVNTKLTEVKAANQQAVRDTASFIGGALGGLAGYKLASSVTERKMADSSASARELVNISASMVTQGIGAFLAQSMSSLLFTAFSRATLPILAIGAAVLSAVMMGADETVKLAKNVAQWVSEVDWVKLGTSVADALKSVASEIGTAIAKATREFASNSDIVDAARTVLPTHSSGPQKGEVDVGTSVVGGIGALALGKWAWGRMSENIKVFIDGIVDAAKIRPYTKSIEAAQAGVATARANELAAVEGNARVLAAAESKLQAAASEVRSLSAVTGQTTSPALVKAQADIAAVNMKNLQIAEEATRLVATAEANLKNAMDSARSAGGATLSASISEAIRNFSASLNQWVADKIGRISEWVGRSPFRTGAFWAVAIAMLAGGFEWCINKVNEFFDPSARDAGTYDTMTEVWKRHFTAWQYDVLNKVGAFFKNILSGASLDPAADLSGDSLLLQNFQKKATGGRISGPGGPRDDRIPAMLSNGEFIVNARDAEKNYDLLKAINSGYAPSYFAGGSDSYTKEQLKQMAIDAAKRNGVDPIFFSSIIAVESNFDPAAKSPTGPTGIAQFAKDTARGMGLVVTKELDERLDPAKALEASARHISELSKKFGTDIDKLAVLYHEGETTYSRKFRNAPFDVNSLDTQEARDYPGKIRKAMANQGVNPAERTAAGEKTTSDKLNDGIKRAYDVGSKFAEQWLARISDFLGFGANRESLAYKAKSAPSMDAASSLIFEAVDADPTLKTLGLTKKRLTELNMEELLAVAERVDVFRELAKQEVLAKRGLSGFEAEGMRDQASRGLRAIGEGKNPAFASGDSSVKLSFADKLRKVESDTDTLNLINSELTRLTKGTIKPLQQGVFQTQEELLQLADTMDILARAAEAPNSAINRMVKENAMERIQKLTADYAERLKIGLENGLGRPASAKAMESGQTMSGQVISETKSGLNDVLTGKKGFAKAKDKDSTSFLGDMLNSFTAKMTSNFTDGLVTMFMKNSGLEKGLSSLFTGNFSFGEKLGETFSGGKKSPIQGASIGSSGVLPDWQAGVAASKFDVAVDKFALAVGSGTGPSIMGKPVGAEADKVGGMTDDFDSLGADLGESTGGIFDSLKDSLSDLTKGLGDTLSGIFGGLKDSLGGMLSGITSMFSGGGGGGLGGMLSLVTSFFADGGPVSGIGTGTSDSIPAMLSNGEYVVRAAQTAKFRPLLEAINTNKFPRFADGGYVGGLSMTPRELGSKQVSTASSSTFNINITGDVSRQTRRTIMEMIPQIASGVGSHNYEQGIK